MKQITVFLENKEGHLSDLVRTVSDSGANMRALTIADTSAYGLVRILASDADRAVAALDDAGYRATLTEVFAVRIGDEPGSLAQLLDIMSNADVNIEYAYCFDQKEGPIAVLKVRDIDAAKVALETSNLEVLLSL